MKTISSQGRVDVRAGRPVLALLVAALLGSSLTGAIETEAERRELNASTFDWVWQRIEETYWDPTFVGEWQRLGDEHRPRALAARDDGELRAVLTDLLAGLGQSHFQILAATPTTGSGAQDGSEGDPGSCDAELRERLLARLEESAGPADPGLSLRMIGERVVVVSVAQGSAAAAGIESGWQLETVEGLDVSTVVSCLTAGLDDGEGEWAVQRALTALLAGPESSRVTLELLDHDDERHELDLARARSAEPRVGFGNLPPMPFRFESEEVETPRGRSVGLIRFNAWLFPLAGAFESAYRELSGADGLIIDLRGNPGGVGGLVMGIGGYLLPEPVSLGTLRSRRDVLEFRVNPRRVSAEGEPIPIFDGPVALLVDGLTASTSEIFAAGLQDLGRVRVFGETTMGAALPALLERMPNGDLLMHAVADFLRPGGSRIEGNGVVPDETVPLTREALARAVDPPLDAALRWIEGSGSETGSGARP